MGLSYFEITVEGVGRSVNNGGDQDEDKSEVAVEDSVKSSNDNGDKGDKDDMGETRSESDDEDPFSVAIGFCGEFAQLTNALCGWRKLSFGYHSDDGGCYANGGRMPERFLDPFGKGDTVGCGVDWERKRYYFTCNGELLGKI
jgi:hypothetical protein